MNADLAAYRELTERIADLEPMSGFTTSDALPKLERVDVALVFAHDSSDVLGALDLPEAEIVRALAGANPIGALGVVFDRALESAARHALYHDVLMECEAREEAAREPPTRESEESRCGVATLFVGSHR